MPEPWDLRPHIIEAMKAEAAKYQLVFVTEQSNFDVNVTSNSYATEIELIFTFDVHKPDFSNHWHVRAFFGWQVDECEEPLAPVYSISATVYENIGPDELSEEPISSFLYRDVVATLPAVETFATTVIENLRSIK